MSEAKREDNSVRGKNVHERIAEKLCEFIDSKEELPWRRSWALKPLLPPQNLSTGKPYQGANQLVLNIVRELNGWESSQWATLRQVGKLPSAPPDANGKRAGPRVAKGAMATPIFRRIYRDPDTDLYFQDNSFDAIQKKLERMAERDASIAFDDEAVMELKARLRPSWMAANVFHPSQCQNIDHVPAIIEEKERYAAALEAMRGEQKNWEAGLQERIETFEARIEQEICPIVKGGNQPAYNPTADQILMPDKEAFGDLRAYALVLAHETVHATGSPKRLNRLQGVPGTAAYAKEELVAEMGAWFTVYALDLFRDPASEDNPLESKVMAGCLSNSQAYLRGWKSRLEDNPRILRPAITAAQRASRAIVEGIDVVKKEFEQQMSEIGIDVESFREEEAESRGGGLKA